MILKRARSAKIPLFSFRFVMETKNHTVLYQHKTNKTKQIKVLNQIAFERTYN